MKLFIPRRLRVLAALPRPLAGHAGHLAKAVLLWRVYGLQTATTYLRETRREQAVEIDLYADSASRDEIHPRWIFTLMEGEF